MFLMEVEAKRRKVDDAMVAVVGEGGEKRKERRLSESALRLPAGRVWEAVWRERGCALTCIGLGLGYSLLVGGKGRERGVHAV